MIRAKEISCVSFILLTLALCSASLSHAMPATAKEETLKLIGLVERSGCQFQRNGEWSDAKDAAAHLRRKLNATEKRLQTTEQFIVHVGSSSSISNKPYIIRCPSSDPVQARRWLEEKLSTLRPAS